jgi:hypothetical protein
MPGSLAAEIERNADFDAFGLVDANKVNVERVDSVRIPLEVTHQGAGLHSAFEFDDAAAVADNRFEGLPLGSEIDTLFPVPVQNSGDEPLATESAGLAGTCGGAGNDFKRIAHISSFRQATHSDIWAGIRKPNREMRLFPLKTLRTTGGIGRRIALQPARPAVIAFFGGLTGTSC